MAEKYLYGASIQGIQEYIFRTNKLADIVHRSDLINEICTTDFKGILGLTSVDPIVMAAGNVKCFLNEADCKKAVREFPKFVQDKAPGVTFSQAVVKMDDNHDFEYACDLLEIRLHVQRNKPMKSVTMGLIGIERDRKTGLPLVLSGKERNKADATLKLYKKLFGKDIKYEDIALDTERLTGTNDWIAVIHADGNGFGEVVANMGKDFKKLRDFSQNLDLATISAAKQACLDVFGDDVMAVRPVVIGGDDMTVICRANKAVDFVREYIKNFEEQTTRLLAEKQLLPDGMTCLTTCAGIAFIKSKYPFYYGYNLAETLCDIAKGDAKSDEIKGTAALAPSCLMFHRVQSSFVESYADIVKKELTPCPAERVEQNGRETVVGHSFQFGPYYYKELQEPDVSTDEQMPNNKKYKQSKRWTIDRLLAKVAELCKEDNKEDNKGDNNKVKNDIREWITLMVNPEMARQKTNRVNAIGSNKKLFIEATTESDRSAGVKVSPAYDILSLQTMEIQVTKQK